MGFIEDLRKQNAAANEPFKVYEEKGRKVAEERRAMAMASNKHFKDSGSEDLIRRVGKLSGEQFYWYTREASLTDWTISNPYTTYDVNHFCEITVSGKGYWQGRNLQFMEYPDGRTYFEIVTTPEGEIRFKGNPEKGSSIIRVSVWKNNKEAIEEAFGRAYRNPMVVHRPKEIKGSGPDSYNPAYPWITM